jgi:hypothetical protein
VNPADIRPPPDPDEVRRAQEALDAATRNLEAARRRVERLANDPNADPVELEIARQRVQEARAALDRPRVALEIAQHPLTENEFLDGVQTRLAIGSAIPLVGPVFAGADAAISARRAERDLENGDNVGAALNASGLIPVDQLVGAAVKKLGPLARRLLGAGAPEVGDVAALATSLNRQERLAAEAVEHYIDDPEAYNVLADGTLVSRRTDLAIPDQVPPGFRADGTVDRVTGSSVLCQNGPTCAPTSAAMLMGDLGIDVPLEQIVDEATALKPPGARPGHRPDQVATVAARHGMPLKLSSGNGIGAVLTATEEGPVLAGMNGTVSGARHLLVVDGLTEVHGQPVVGIRDPNGFAFFLLLTEFEKSFDGTLLVPVR